MGDEWTVHGGLTVILLSALIGALHAIGDYSLTVPLQRCWGHGLLLAVVLPHLRVLPVRGGEEDRRRGQGDPEDPQAAEEEGEKGG